MAKEKIDKKTQKLLDDGRELKNLVESSGWQTAKKELLKKLAVLDSITSLPSMKSEDRLLEMSIREGVISVILEWIRDIEGSVEQHKQNTKALSEIREEQTIFYTDF